MTFCLRGRELLWDLQRADFLPPYDDEGLRQVILEISDLVNKASTVAVQGLENQPAAVKVGFQYHTTCLNRNLRYLFAFYTHRLAKLRGARWEGGSVLPEGVQQSNTLSPAELDYFSAYNRLVSDYNESVGLDLTSDLEPPKDLNVEVRVVAPDLGEIMTDGGPVALELGSVHFLRRSDVEFLIRLGHLEMIKS
jgi:GINS complex subunit 1